MSCSSRIALKDSPRYIKVHASTLPKDIDLSTTETVKIRTLDLRLKKLYLWFECSKFNSNQWSEWKISWIYHKLPTNESLLDLGSRRG